MHGRWLSALAAAALAARVAPTWGAQPARPAERIAVFVVGATPEDHELAEDLGEVIIGQVARARDAEIAGAEELRARMAITSEAEAAACLADLHCLARAGGSLGVRRAVIGTVAHAGSRLMLSLEWVDLEGATPPRRMSRTVEGGLAEIARASQSAVDELFQTAPAAPPAAAALPATAGRLTIRAPARSRVLVDEVPVGVAQMPLRKHWASPVFWSGCGLTAAALATGALFGALSNGEPGGQTRGAIQRSLEEQNRQRMIATGALVTAAAAAVFTAFIGIRYRDHIWTSGN